MKKRILCLTLGLVLTFSQVMTVSASSRKQKLKEEKAATQSQLSQQQIKINELEEKKAALSAEINELDANLVSLLVQMDILEGDLEKKEVQIQETKENLSVAEENRDKQYQDMKKRIQYLYEKGGDDAWTQLLFQAEDLASLLNKAEYVQKLYDSDRKSLEEFKATVQEVTDLGNQLETEKGELEGMQIEYQNQQADLEKELEQKKIVSNDYETQIANAESKAAAYADLIRQQNSEIRKIEVEEQKAAEEAARKAAEAAAKAAEEEQKAAQKEESKKQESNGDTSTGKENGTNNKPSNGKDTITEKPTTTPKPTATPKPTQKPEKDEPSSNVPMNPNGSAIVSKACEYVGNPYKHGGNSLTEGIDCSGFIQQIYAMFGYSLPRSSGAYLSVGTAVPYSQAQPGDIICYSGHVAIYMGGGAIVHASNSKPYPQGGIKITSNAQYREILSVRRVL